MALQNALGALALDTSIQTLIAAINTLQTQLAESNHSDLAFPPRALQYARTVNDQLRVNVDAGSITSLVYMGNNSTAVAQGSTNYVGWYQPSAAYSIDQREQQRELSQQTFNAVRQGRWTFS